MKLSRQKKIQLAQVLGGAAVIVAGLWFGLVKYQLRTLDELAGKKDAAQKKITEVRDTIKNSGQIDAELAELSATLEKEETDMATGDSFSWMISFVKKYRAPYRVDIPQFTPGNVGSVTLLSGFPYQQVTISIGGTAFYHDLGRFIADFENQFPYSQMLDLELEPAKVQAPGESEKLEFQLKIATLIKSTVKRSDK